MQPQIQIFFLRARQVNDIDQIVMLRDGKWFLFKEEKNAAAPVRLTLQIQTEQIAMFFHNREVEVMRDETAIRHTLVQYGQA